jgi:hypothetical protein
VIGYYPSNPRRNGEYRTIRVTVNRPGVTVLHRHSYRASDEIPAFDRRAYITQFRMQAAAAHASDINDIPVKVQASVAPVKGGQFEVTVNAVIDPSRLTFVLQDGLYVGRLEVAVVATSTSREVIAGVNHSLVPQFTAERFAAIQKEGLRCTVRMAVPSGSRHVRFIVYDYEADLVGSAGTWVF